MNIHTAYMHTQTHLYVVTHTQTDTHACMHTYRHTHTHANIPQPQSCIMKKVG